MNALIKKICTCGHPEHGHKYRDYDSSEALLDRELGHHVNIEIIRHPDRNAIIGYNIKNEGNIEYHSYEDALSQADDLRTNWSRCSRCICSVFKIDNLKYLEDLSER